MPKRVCDKNIVKKIRNVLKKNSQGLWVREIARRSDIPKSTVDTYLNKHMKNEIEDVLRGYKNFIRIVRLKK